MVELKSYNAQPQAVVEAIGQEAQPKIVKHRQVTAAPEKTATDEQMADEGDWNLGRGGHGGH